MTDMNEFSKTYVLTADKCDAQSRMPLWLITTAVIETATLHANALGIGYSDLITHGIGWVLSRLSVEMSRYPGVNEEYTVTTWIESINRLYSDRCFCITDASGAVVGYVRSVWAAIDMRKRCAADLSCLDLDALPIGKDRECPVARMRRAQVDAPESISRYTFNFSDLDFNRHVNTVQYVRHILGRFPLERFDADEVARFDISFHKECRYGQDVDFKVRDTPDLSTCDIVSADSIPAVTSALAWRPRI